MKSPLGRYYIYTLQTVPDGTRLVPQTVEESTSKRGIIIGVINPALFDLLGKKIRMAFLTIDKYAAIEQQIKNCGFETLALLGQYDLLVTHIHENRYDMIYDIMQVIPLRMSISLRTQAEKQFMNDDVEANFPYYSIDAVYKVLGVPISYDYSAVFDGPDKPLPTSGELAEILKLAQNWEDETVLNSAREKFLERRWILGKTSKELEDVSAVVTIYLDHAGPQVTDLLASFDKHIVPALLKKSAVTSLYRGKAQGLAIHYLLKVSTDAESLMSLIGEIHDLAIKARLLITTSTNIVVRKLSSMSFERSLLSPVIPSIEKHYRDHSLLPKLSSEDRVRAIYLPEAEQRIFIRHYQKLSEAINRIADLDSLKEKITEVEKELAAGLLHEDFMLLRGPHDILQARAETLLRDFIEREITDEQVETWRVEQRVPAGKKKDTLTFPERIRLTTHYIEGAGGPAELLYTLRKMMEVIRVRNAFAHSSWERLTIEDYVEAVLTYTDFLSKWDSRTL